MSKPWFRPKTYGYGATPNSWEGWLATALFIVAIVVDMGWLPLLFPDRQTGHLVAIGGAALLALGLVALTLIKTDRPWLWRWGKDD